MSDANKEEAARAFLLAKKKLATGDVAGASRLLKIAGRLDPSDSSITQLSQRVEHMLRSQQRERPRPEVRKNLACVCGICMKICRSTDHYEALSVPRDAPHDTIRKSYRKLALKLHPDKSTCPKSEDAFKSISAAFACLGDKEKRSTYDMYGSEEPSMASAGPFRRRGGPGMQGQHFASMDDAFLNMFFNAYTQQQRGPPRRQNPRHQRQRATGTHVHQGSPMGAWIPGLLFLLMTFLLSTSWSSFKQAEFGMTRSSDFPVEKKTPNDVPFFVSLARSRQAKGYDHLYSSVDQRFLEVARSQCRIERQQQQQLYDRARWSWTTAQKQKLVQQANAHPLTACNSLNAFTLAQERRRDKEAHIAQAA